MTISRTAALSALALATALTGLLALSATSASQGNGHPSQVVPPALSADRVEGHKAFDFDAEVGAVLELSLLPSTANAEGQQVRAISAVLMYQKATAYLGTANFHQLVAMNSTQTIDLSIKKLDLSIDATADDAPSEFRSYRATIAPRLGATWGTVLKYPDDVVLLTAPE